MEMIHEEVTENIIRAFYKVYNTLGYGFLEKVYESAFYLEILQSGLQVIRQSKIQRNYTRKFFSIPNQCIIRLRQWFESIYYCVGK